MSSMTLRALRAKHGDSLLLFAGDATVLIDGGPSGVYRGALRDALTALPGQDGAAPMIDLMMVSHIDADHIYGLVHLLTHESGSNKSWNKGREKCIRYYWGPRADPAAPAIRTTRVRTDRADVRQFAAANKGEMAPRRDFPTRSTAPAGRPDRS